MNNLKELLVKPVWQMTGEEFLFLSRHASVQAEAQPQPTTDTERKYVYGILGIAKLFGCSLPTANRIKKSGKIDKAITQIGRKIIVDAELALELAGIFEYEKVQIVDIENGNRFETYVIAGERESGMICLNGAAARQELIFFSV